MIVSVSIAAALLLDRLAGEMRRWHPLVGFGHAATWLDKHFRPVATVAPAGALSAREKLMLVLAGAFSWGLLVLLPAAITLALMGSLSEFWNICLGVVILYFCVGARSLADHARAIAAPLVSGDLVAARQKLSLIVSRDTSGLDEEAVTKGAIESVLENGSDAVIAPLFWFFVGGAPAALAYRFANTLDAMWGYRTARFRYFGFFAARLDDLLNWIPARCCALAYAFSGGTRGALRCWRTQAYACDSPNAGPVMAAGAGALGVLIGGPASYSGETVWRPALGLDGQAVPQDIERALRLLTRATVMVLAALVLLEALLWL